MAQLAIKGHKSRGNEVIEILEMLGGKNLYNYCADCDSLCFYIGKETNIIYYDDANTWCEDEEIVLTLEEFLEKIPYKVGDKVLAFGKKWTIVDAVWDGSIEEVVYTIKSETSGYTTTKLSNQLQPYKEEAMDKAIKAVFDAKVQCCDIMNHLIKEETMEEELIPRIDFNKYCKDKYLLDLGNYEIKEENGKTYAVRKQFEHPKTYEECCEVLDIESEWHLTFELNNSASCDLCINKEFEYICKLEAFRKLLICRDAYWKIGGDWKYDVNKTEEYFYIVNKCGRIVKEHYMNFNHILAFPTEEMRDAFYENFKELINQCKELL